MCTDPRRAHRFQPFSPVFQRAGDHSGDANRKNPMRPACLMLFAVLLSLAAAGCSILPAYTNANEKLPDNEPPPLTRASVQRLMGALKNGRFIGIAMSGGGSRAANFSAAVLFELQEAGLFPDYVSALSSVSGSSLTAAYYGLNGDKSDRWRKDRVKEILLKDFEAPWIGGWFLPWNMFLYWFTDFDRSDIMKGVFDDQLFEKRTFGEMAKHGPAILLNATVLGRGGATVLGVGGNRFIFADEAFAFLGSRLDTYPVSHAVMASGAFPAAFHSVTLRDYSQSRSSGKPARQYLHLYDGGPPDNLGVTTLLDIAGLLHKKSGTPLRACFLIVIDAHTFDPSEERYAADKRDPRALIDFFIDRNALYASDVLLAKDRQEILRRVGIEDPRFSPTGEVTLFKREDEQIPRVEPLSCVTWVVSFERLEGLLKTYPPVGPDEYVKELTALRTAVNRISTRYVLTSPDELPAQDLQDALYRTARILVWDDPWGLRSHCNWFGEQGIRLRMCPEEGGAR